MVSSANFSIFFSFCSFHLGFQMYWRMVVPNKLSLFLMCYLLFFINKHLLYFVLLFFFSFLRSILTEVFYSDSLFRKSSFSFLNIYWFSLSFTEVCPYFSALLVSLGLVCILLPTSVNCLHSAYSFLTFLVSSSVCLKLHVSL